MLETNGKNETSPSAKKIEGGEMAEHGGKIIAFSEKMRELMQQREAKKKLLDFADKVDENAAMQKLRKFWDDSPKAVKWAMLHLPMVGGVYSPVIKFLVQAGILEYDGLSEEKDVQAMTKWETLKLEWGVKIGAIFLPELKPFLPLVEPLVHLKGTTDEILTDVRYHLKEKRARAKEKKQIDEIREELIGSVQQAA